MLKLHAYEIIASAVTAVKNFSKEQGFPVHGAVYSHWGAGKTIACKQVKQSIPDTFYLKAPVRNIEPSGLLREILISLRVGPGRGYAINYEYLTTALATKGIVQPVLLIDEAQMLFTKPTLLSFLKDLSEDPEIGFVYVFIGDDRLKTIISTGRHSIAKRIRVKKEIPSITKETIEKLADYHHLKLEEDIFQTVNDFKASTIDVDFALYLAKKAKTESLNKKLFKAFLKKAME